MAEENFNPVEFSGQLRSITPNISPLKDSELPFPVREPGTGEDIVSPYVPRTDIERKADVQATYTDIQRTADIRVTEFDKARRPSASLINAAIPDPIYAKSMEVSAELTHAPALHSGVMLPKTDIYFHGRDSEDILGRNQSQWEKVSNGLMKFGAKIGLYALGGATRPVDILVNSISKKSLSAGINSDYSKLLEDWDEQYGVRFRHYYKKEERDMNFFQALRTTNFWFDKALGGAAYTIATIGNEAAWAAATGGTSLFLAGGKAALGAGARALTRTAYVGMRAAAQQTGQALAKGSTIAKAANTARFLATSVPNEAAVETMGFRKEAEQEYISSYEAANGKRPSYDELKTYRASLDSAANAVFAANGAILSVSNLATIGTLFGITGKFGGKIGSFRDRTLGLGFERSRANPLVWKARVPTRTQKVAAKISPMLGAIATEGFWEEGQQGTVSNAAQAYISSRFNPDSMGKTLSTMEAYWEGAKEAYGSAQGSQEIGIGGIIGAVFGLGSMRRASKRRAYNREVALGSQANSALLTNSVLNTLSRLHAFNGMNSSSGKVFALSNQDIEGIVEASGLTDSNDKAILRTRLQNEGGLVSEALKSLDDTLFGRFSIDHAVDGLETTEANFNNFIDAVTAEEAGFERGDVDAFENYKKEVKGRFTQRLSDFKAANKIAESLTESVGYTPVYGQMIAKNIYNGIAAADMVKQLSSEIESLSGGNVKEAIEMAARFSKEDAQAVQEMKGITDELLAMEQDIIKLNVASQQAKDTETYTQRIAELSKKYEELRLRREALSTKTAAAIEAQGFDFDALTNVTFDGKSGVRVNMEEILDGLAELERYEASLNALSEENNRVLNAYKTIVDQYRDAALSMRSSRDFMNQISDKRFMRNTYKGFLGALAKLSNSKRGEVEIKDYTDVEFGTAKDMSDNDLAIAFKEGKISEDEYYTFKAYNHLLWDAKESRTKIEAPVEEVLSDEAVNDIMNVPPTSGSTGTGPTARAKMTWWTEINDVVEKLRNGETLTPNQRKIYDSVDWFRDAVNERAGEIPLTMEEIVRSVTEKLEEAKKSNIAEVVENMEQAIEDNSTEDEATEIKELGQKVKDGTITLDEMDLLRTLSETAGVPGYVDGLLTQAIDESRSQNIANVATEEPVSTEENPQEGRETNFVTNDEVDPAFNDAGATGVDQEVGNPMVKKHY